MKVKYTYGCSTGISRLNQGMECQDKVRTFQEEGISAVILTDGTGRKKASGLCASITADAAANLLKNRFEELFSAEEELTKQMIIASIMNHLGDTELALIDMSSTLLFVAVKGSRYLAANIGNGIIVRREESCSVLSGPQDGSYGNETNYITDLDAVDKIQIYKGELAEPFGFMLLSNGAVSSLYDTATGNLSAACNTLLQWLDENDEATVGEALTENIEKYFTKNTEDDITIALMVSDDTEEEIEIEATVEVADKSEVTNEVDSAFESTDEVIAEAEAIDKAKFEAETAEDANAEASVANDANIETDVTDKAESSMEAVADRTSSESPSQEAADEGSLQNTPDQTGLPERLNRKNKVLALVVVAAAVILCIAISLHLSSSGKDQSDSIDQSPNATENQDISSGESNSPDQAAASSGGISSDNEPSNIGQSSDQTSGTETSNNPLAAFFPSVTYSVENPEIISAGTYQAGLDIPAGEYFFYSTDMLKPGGINIDGESCLSGELYCMKILLQDGETLTSSYDFTASDNVKPLQTVNGVFISGKYKIGTDIAPGQYMAMPISNDSRGKYYSILDGEISNDTAFRVPEAVIVPEEGYIVLYNASIASSVKELESAAASWK